MAADQRAAPAIPGRLQRKRLVLVAVALAATGLGVSACTTGDVFALQPAVDVGQTASLPMVEVAPQPAPVMAASASDAQMMASVPAAIEPTLDAQAETLGEIAPVAPQPVQTASLAPAQGRGMQTLAPSNPYMVAYPKPEDPSTLQQAVPQRVPAMMPADEVDCRNDLKKLDVQYRDLPSISAGAACGIDYPVKVSAIGSVQMKPAATVTCAMAASFAAWTKRELVPAARLRYFTGVKTIHQGSSYSCRKIAGSRTLSEHGKGNALDIMRIELNSGRDIEVEKPGLFAFRTRGFLNTVRSDGCNYFNTVLGPGYNYDHRNHFHFDIKQRRNGYRACR
ncbi:extensin-like domain-containing protein [Aminobacter sp. HY435]|uniref:extensin-like domain-containing protein n=1 Tax=Aminobacter sp. HY435 TaxID=2970917 RepID=UPI0022B99F98|nr:extensin family protein [Aminobacter sp. HY435]